MQDFKTLPCLSSAYSLGRSILTLEEPGKTNKGEPDSIFDICKEFGINDLYLVENSISGFLEAQKNAEKAQINLRFGLKLNFCNDINVKDDESTKSEHKVIVFALNSQGYYDLIKISTKAATDGFYYHARMDFANLKTLWTKNLGLAIPFYDSFLFKNTLTFSSIVPDFPCEPIFFIENHDLPFDKLVLDAVINYTKDKYKCFRTHSIYYKLDEDFEAYNTFRCISERTTLAEPNFEHFSVNNFSAESWKKLNE